MHTIFQPIMMITNIGIMTGVWLTFIWIVTNP